MDNEVIPAYTSPIEVMKALQTGPWMYEVRERTRVEFFFKEPAKVAEVIATLDGISATMAVDGYMMVSIQSTVKPVLQKKT